MSQAEVLASEEIEPIYKSFNRVLYATSVIEKQVMLEYHLANDRLYRARYVLAAHHVIDGKYLSDYRDFQSVLTAKYGKPEKDEKIWKKGVGIREDMNPGTLVSIGDLTLVSVWETPDTEIVAAMTGKNFEVHCEVTYTSKALKQMAQKHDHTDPTLGGKGGKLGGAFGSDELEDAARDF
jgi:hypothetical protein